MRFGIVLRQSLVGSAWLSTCAVAAAFGQAPQSPLVVNLDALVVTAPLGLSRSEIVEGTSVLEGEALDRRRAGTVGETLRGLPGVAATGFGPGASRPVIRGQGGPRVRVLDNGLDTFDASTVSPDHAVAAPVDGARRIEVLRGPATLLYGSSAVGGLVNVIDGRIAEALPPGGHAGTARVDYGSAAGERGGFAGLDVALGGNLALHAEGFARNAGNYSISGFASDEARERGQEDEVENSFARSRGGSVGASYIGGHGFLGVAVSRFETRYGIPGGGHAHAHGDEEHEHDDEDHDEEAHEDEEEEGAEQVAIDLRQTRYDLRFGLDAPLAGVQALKGRVGYATYEHVELESGAVGTTFENRAWEGRLEAEHAPLGPFEGVLGVQAGRRDFQAIGAEAFVPPTLTDSHALFLLERGERGPWLFSLGGRLEYQRVEADTIGRTRRFSGANASAAATYRLDGEWSVGASLAHTERLPSAEELFANGPHIATRSFEIGDPDLEKERAWTAELSLRKRRGPVTGSLNLFASRYRDFIFGDFTGTEEDGLQVLQFGQTEARFHGLELEAGWRFLETENWVFGLDGRLDYVRAENRRTGSPLPLIPPVGYAVGLTADQAQFGLRLEVQGAARQHRNAPEETETEGHAFVNAGIAWRPLADDDSLSLLVEVRNLADAEGRNHVSLLKDVAPLRGREVRVVGQVRF